MATASRSRSSSIDLSPKQDAFVFAADAVILYRGAIASGKTVAGGIRSIVRRLQYPGTVQLIGGPSWDQLRDGTMRSLRRLLPEGAIVAENKVEHHWTLANGSEWIFRTLDDPDVLRALEVHDIWVDEITLCSEEVLDIGLGRMRLPCVDPTFRHGFWATATPRGMDWTLGVFGDGKPGYGVVHSTIYDNRPNLPEGYIERLEEKYRDTPFFEQELLGMYTAFEGLVYPMFRKETHVKGIPCLLSECRRVVVGVDFGGIMPTAMVLLGQRQSGRIHQYAEYYRTGAELGDMMARLELWALEARLRRGQLAVVCDTSEQVSIATLRAAGFNAFGANKERASGIKYVAQQLNGQGGQPGYSVSPECVYTIGEFGQYVWASKRDAATKVVYRGDAPIDHHADAMDALRYGLVAFGQSPERHHVTVGGRTYAG